MRLPYRNKKTTFWVMLVLIVATMCLLKFTDVRPTCFFRDDPQSMMLREEKYVMDEQQKRYSYGREMPLIFIGGVPRSGTTLMRAMLDAHPDVRCGQETRVIPRILQLRSHWLKSEKESLRLAEAGITKEVMNSAIAQFCLEIIAKHGEPAPRLCNKDPLTLKMGSYVIELFPNAKFLFMVRDGRATVHSIISRKVTITGFDLTSYRQCMQKWNHAIEVMHAQCKEIGKDRCMMVYYEQLVLHPEEWMHKILEFLDVPWNDAVLHHEEFINKPNGVPLSKVERSSDQVIKPVNLEALTKWVGQIPENVVRDMAELAPMLSVLGYDPYSNPPNYGKPDDWVKDNTWKVKANRRQWENKAKEVLALSPRQNEVANRGPQQLQQQQQHRQMQRVVQQQQQQQQGRFGGIGGGNGGGMGGGMMMGGYGGGMGLGMAGRGHAALAIRPRPNVVIGNPRFNQIGGAPNQRIGNKKSIDNDMINVNNADNADAVDNADADHDGGDNDVGNGDNDVGNGGGDTLAVAAVASKTINDADNNNAAVAAAAAASDSTDDMMVAVVGDNHDDSNNNNDDDDDDDEAVPAAMASALATGYYDSNNNNNNKKKMSIKTEKSKEIVQIKQLNSKDGGGEKAATITGAGRADIGAT